jgi:hypothetical protein
VETGADDLSPFDPLAGYYGDPDKTQGGCSHMTWKRVAVSLLSGVLMLLVSFALTNLAYIRWAEWRHPDNSSMAGMGAAVLGLMVAPVCALVTAGLVLSWPNRKKKVDDPAP